MHNLAYPVRAEVPGAWVDPADTLREAKWEHSGCMLDATGFTRFYMDQQKLKSQLLDLATQGEKRVTKMDKFRDVFPFIEKAVQAGISRQQILDLLNGDGYGMTMASFKSYLQRARKEAEGPKMDSSGCRMEATKKPTDVSGRTGFQEDNLPELASDSQASQHPSVEPNHRRSMAEFLPLPSDPRS